MFNFQKEVVINDANLLSIDTNHIKIDREGDYKKDCVVDTTVYHTMGVKPFVDRMFMRVGEFDPAIVGKHVQFVFELSTKTDYQGEFATATWKFKKPVIVDIELPEDVSEAVVALINACNTVGSKYWRAYTTVPTNPTALFIEMSDANLKIVNFKIYSFDCAESCVDPHEEVNLIYEWRHNIVTVGAVSYIKGHPGFGTYEYILHNLRLPSSENLRFASPMAVEMPIAGQLYDQISFTYRVDRRLMGGMSVAGQINKSVVTVTMYVPRDSYDALKTKLTDGGYTIVDMQNRPQDESHVTVLPDAEVTKADLKGEVVSNELPETITAEVEGYEKAKKSKK